MPGSSLGDAAPSVAFFPLASAVLDVHGVVVSWNPAAEAMFGWSVAEAVGSGIEELTGWGGLEAITARLRQGASLSPIVDLRDRHGAVLRAQLSFGGIRNDLQEVTALVLVVSHPVAMQTDNTERRLTNFDLVYVRERLAEAEKLARLGSWTVDPASGAFTCSAQLCELIGVDPEIGLAGFDELLALIHPDEPPRGAALDRRVREALGPITEELCITTIDGRERWVVLRAEAAAGPRGSVLICGTLQDVTDRKAREAELSHVALHDKLTGLPNRSLFGDRLNHALMRRKGAVTVMLVDLDGFKAINDHLGHAAGDALLVTVASRLSGALRPSDTIARLGGDEFSVLLEDAAEGGAVEAATRLLDALAPPVHLEGRSVSVQASVGIAIGPAGSMSADELLRKADAAMYSAKCKGGSRCEVFIPQMDAVDANRLTKNDLRSVQLGSEMILHYQPLVDLRDGRLSGFEALLRWNHPVRGPIAPDAFIPIAEASGVIIPIGRWVLTEACRQLRAWQGDGSLSSALSMNVNVSSRQLADGHLVEDVARAIDISSVDPRLLTLEITETMIMADEDEVGHRLRELKELGVRISVDDFGTGYSSMGHLERFPVDELKIDRSFVASLGRSGQDSGVALGVLRLARSLRLDVVAEGIERVEQLNELRRAACTTGQGYFFAKALHPMAVESLLSEVTHYPLPESLQLVLLVDDEESLRLLTARILRNAGYDVVEAGTGAEAIRIAEKTRLDAVILDVGLPDMNGFEISERLRDVLQGGVPIIYLSGTAIGVDDRVRGLNLGAEAYLTKPVAPEELIAVLGASLRSHGAAAAANWTTKRQAIRTTALPDAIQ
jgi:diguanylate cyclase (GGDEF)-like protein/PAS domain S-box-containing protein